VFFGSSKDLVTFAVGADEWWGVMSLSLRYTLYI
jgi:hypothetical protein